VAGAASHRAPTLQTRRGCCPDMLAVLRPDTGVLCCDRLGLCQSPAVPSPCADMRSGVQAKHKIQNDSNDSGTRRDFGCASADRKAASDVRQTCVARELAGACNLEMGAFSVCTVCE